MTLPNGTIYDVCTTIQYNAYKPSSNSTTITVTLQTTTSATTLRDMVVVKAEDPRSNITVTEDA